MKELGSCLARLHQMNEQIINRTTGSPEEFAGKIGVSRRTFFEYLDVLKGILKEYDVTILYNPGIRSYQYSKPGRLEMITRWICND